ncbi:Peptidase M23 [Methylocella silvestris BL2]|uniref:Peptidase M23 n=1 Tax=Methylocella silvestris (strain DSM 15510 / CIP 108128 / LMG 27833 / NCIMB 13906 / BL2) TaxID=395965 RepID=B8EQH8_METSB|nr:Peptidase M23 [Methylocella silvestris BL2]
MTMDAPLRSHQFVPGLWLGRFQGGVDLGHEPAIEADGKRHSSFDRRRISFRWLSGTILTGVSGGALIGAAIYASLGNHAFIPEPPSLAPRKEINVDFGVNQHKADRLVKAVDIVAAKQSFRAPTTIKVGDKEVMKTHTFTRVETTLLTSSSGFADVPAFNPLKILADARNPIDVAPEPVQDDAEVSWTMRDVSVENLAATSLSDEEVRAQVAEHVKNSATAGSRQIALPPQLLLMRTARANLPGMLAYANPAEQIKTTPFSAIEVRMVPENVTNVARAPQPAKPAQTEERLVVVRHGETLDDVLRAAGLSRDKAALVIAAFKLKAGESAAPEGRRIKLLFADLEGAEEKTTLARLSVYQEESLESAVAINDRGDYVRVTAPARPAKRQTDDSEDEDGLRLYDSLYETALKQEIPRPIIDDLVRVFANDVDFQRSVSGGDSFEAFYDESDEGEARNQLLYATITARGETYRYYRYQTPDDGVVDFYDQDGRSTRKFLVRTPILNAKFTSGFGSRFHPILGYTRPHTGVDWAAPIGTPIVAAGNGVIVKAGWDSGYGRRVEIEHANGYVTTYNHMSGFARGAGEGARVKQGQVIGYLGQTGLATGPHLHYEVLVNGHFVDPMKVKLSRTREFDGRMLANFKRERDRIDSLLAEAPAAERVVAEQRSK